MLNPLQLRDVFKKLLLIYSLIAMIGFVVDQLVLVLFIATFAILALNLKQFVSFLNWLWNSPQKRFVSHSSHWDQMYYGVEKIQRANRVRRRQLVNSIGEFRQGADALPDGVTVYNQHNEIIWSNRQARLLLGLKWPIDQGQRLDNLIRHPKFTTYLSLKDFEQVLLLPSPINDEIVLENRIIEYGKDQYLLVTRDITHVHQLEQMRREFVANVSHELKTPLTVLQGYLEMLEQDNSPAIKAMEQQSKRMQALVEQLLSLSKIESGATASNTEAVNMAAQMEMLKEDAHNLIGQRRLTIAFNIDQKLDIVGHDTQIFSACSNLVFNAIRYCPEGAKITVAWQHCPQGARFVVKDNGNGIASHHLSRLTERFYRIESSRSSKDGGTGLGLSIVKHVLANHQSTLRIDSRVDIGSTFSFIIKEERVISAY